MNERYGHDKGNFHYTLNNYVTIVIYYVYTDYDDEDFF